MTERELRKIYGTLFRTAQFLEDLPGDPIPGESLESLLVELDTRRAEVVDEIIMLRAEDMREAAGYAQADPEGYIDIARQEVEETLPEKELLV